MIHPMTIETKSALREVRQDGISALILDDNQFDRMKIRRLFRTSGMPVYLDESDTIESLSEILDQQEFDVILVDYKLPESTGIDALRLVKEHPVNNRAATIMITGLDQSDIAVESMKMGCMDYISKEQLSAARLRRSVIEVIERAERAHSEDHRREAYVANLMQTIMAEYSAALQPELAKIVREMRALKATLGDPTSNLPDDLEQIEKRCIRLWSVLTSPQELGLSERALSRIQ